MALGSELLAWRSDVFARSLRVLTHGFVSLCALIVVCNLCFTCSVSFQIFFSLIFFLSFYVGFFHRVSLMSDFAAILGGCILILFRQLLQMGEGGFCLSFRSRV